MDMSPPTSTELDSYLHKFFTSDMEWNPQSIVGENHPDTINAYGELLPVARQQDIHF
jgi:hypothetical protein